MTPTQQQLYYSASHWERMEKDQYKYIKEVSPRFANAELDFCSVEYSRAVEVILSIEERAAYCELQKRRMLSRQPVINGICFGRMLDDLKKDLHKRIDERFEKDRTQTDIQDRASKAARELRYALSDAARRVWQKPRRPGDPITLLGQAIASTSAAFQKFYDALSPIHISQDGHE